MSAYSRRPSVWIERRRSSTGVWTYRVRAEKDGKRLPDVACGPNKEHAQRVLAREQERLWGYKLGLPTPGASVSLSAWAMQDAARRETRQSAATVRMDRRALALFIEYFGDAPLRDVNRAAVAGFETWLRRRTWTRRADGVERLYHVNNLRIILRSLKAAMRRALKDDLIDRDPFFGYEMPPEVSVANPPDRAAALKLWNALPSLGRHMVAVDLSLGLRRGELLALTAASLTPPAPGRDHWLVTVQKSKTRRGKVEHKTMALPAQALAALQAMKPWPKSGPLFKVSPTYLSHMVSRAARQAGLGRVRLHDLRHRWATDLMAACRDEYALMQVGGWTSRAAVARYQHATPQRRDVTLQILGHLPPNLPPNRGGRRVRKKDSSSGPGR